MYKGQRNPLYSYELQRKIVDRLTPFPDADYSKPEGYETCRYPYSGLSGSQDEVAAEQHNEFASILAKVDDLLNGNVKDWLNMESFETTGGKVQWPTPAGKYNIFSNTTSAQRWNDDQFQPTKVRPHESGEPSGPSNVTVALESPCWSVPEEVSL
ncbi:LOW QUALITY PROTEIN: hypothetical protein AJ79_08724 [Helicocarpus griseus UAMH5409]|uniref:Uncharacterized protein n=1 Tax=Helicocarpus griseus UAMH5409 TaxID=1447875 RepID=A0A2B7WQJ4_9EURO|nr:LOW QUALITY PROTEIN: hypothetical protein AJ79_08724 [Helicocarpus griseus UAMH5409]